MLEKNNVIKIIPLTTNSKTFKHRSIGLILNERMGKNWLIYSQLKIHKLPIDRCYIASTEDFSDVITCFYTRKKRKAIEHYIPKKVVDRAKAQGHLYIIHTIEATPEHLFEVDKKNYSGQRDLTKKVYDLLQIKF